MYIATRFTRFFSYFFYDMHRGPNFLIIRFFLFICLAQYFQSLGYGPVEKKADRGRIKLSFEFIFLLWKLEQWQWPVMLLTGVSFRDTTIV